VIHYTLALPNPRTHTFQVTCSVATPEPSGQQFCLPAWIPGSYVVRDYARHVMRFRAWQANGAPLAVTKLDKNTWRCAPSSQPITVQAEIYSHDFTVRTAFVDHTRAYCNGPCVFFQVQGQEDLPCQLHLPLPMLPEFHAWRVATSMSPIEINEAGFGYYQAENYADFIDHPLEIGTWQSIDFTLHHIPHRIVISGLVALLDRQRLLEDITRICQTHAALFHGLPADLDRYVFLLMISPDSYGGLEHRFGTSLMADPQCLPMPGLEPGEDYQKLLGLFSHEYLHLWFVKRICPQVMKPLTLHREVYTRQLWIFEGITSYYDDLHLVRSACITLAQYLKLLETQISRLWQNPGRTVQSLSESSFDTWTKLYQPNANTPNAVVSYYLKGALVALCLDLYLRWKTDGAFSLDDMMRTLWQRYDGQNSAVLPEGEFEQLIAQQSGVNLDDFFARYVDGYQDPPLAECLAAHGIGLRAVAGPPGHWLGVKLSADQGPAILKHVYTQSPAQQAGLAPDDEIVAIASQRVYAHTLYQRLAAWPCDHPLPIHAFRRDQLLAFEVIPIEPPQDKAQLLWETNASCEAASRRAAWLAAIE